MTTIGKDFPVRAHAFLLSSEKRASSAEISPADTLCFDIFSPPPGDSDVTNQVDRLSSNEMNLRKDRPGSWLVLRFDQLRFAWSPPEWVVSDLILPKRRSLPSPHGISKRTMCRPTRRRFRGRLIRPGEMSDDDAQSLHRGSGGSTHTRKARATREAPWRGQG